MFSLCLGNKHGYLQLGGFDGQGHYDEQINWIGIQDSLDFKFYLYGMRTNDDLIDIT